MNRFLKTLVASCLLAAALNAQAQMPAPPEMAVLRPKTEAEIAEIVRGTTTPLCITGGGTRRIGQKPTK